MSGQTRPDIAFDVCHIGVNFKYSNDKDIRYTSKIIAHLKQDPVQVMYQNLGNECNLKHNICSCNSWQFKWWWNQFGYLIMLVGDHGKCSLLNWQSKQVKHVVRSTLAVETLSLSDAVDDGIYISEIVS